MKEYYSLMKKFNKNAQILKYIIEHLSAKLGRTHLIKLVYLADYHSRRLFGNPVSTFDYYYDKQGPFNKEFYPCVESLKGYVKEEEINFSFYKGYLFHNTSKKIEYKQLSQYDLYILDYVINTYGKANLQSLLEDVVYKTEPMLEVVKKRTFKSKLPMDIVDNLDKKHYEGLSPENMVDSEKAIFEGKTQSLEEVLSALQG